MRNGRIDIESTRAVARVLSRVRRHALDSTAVRPLDAVYGPACSMGGNGAPIGAADRTGARSALDAESVALDERDSLSMPSLSAHDGAYGPACALDGRVPRPIGTRSHGRPWTSSDIERARDLGLNCHQLHSIYVRRHGGQLHYGWAHDGRGDRYQHVWASLDGVTIDLFDWSAHEDLGTTAPVPTADLISYLRDNGLRL